MNAKRTRFSRINIDPAVLAKQWRTMTILQIAALYQCSEGCISKKAQQFGLGPKKRERKARKSRAGEYRAPPAEAVVPELAALPKPAPWSSFIAPPTRAQLMSGR